MFFKYTFHLFGRKTWFWKIEKNNKRTFQAYEN